MAKKTKAKKVKAEKPQRVEIVVRQESSTPSVSDLAQPIREGKALTIPKTWMSEHQLTFMLQNTPKKYVYKRPGKGGKTFDYVTVSYIQKALNYAFGWNWDFEIVEHGKESNHVWVLGKLTVRGMKEGQSITKTQFGRSEVKVLREGGNVDYGNDLKAAASDALKKCASLLGIASDVYGKTDYKAESGNDPQEPVNHSAKEAQDKSGEESQEFVDHICQWPGRGGCGKDITAAEGEYSKRLYGRELCKDHYPKGK